MDTPVLIVAPDEDLHALAVANVLRSRGVAFEWVDLCALDIDLGLSLANTNGVEARLATVAGQDIALSEVGTVWWRRPRLPATANMDGEIGGFVRGEWEHFLESVEPFSAARWVNPPAANRLAGRKGHQLVTAGRERLRVPRTLVTNDPTEASTFASALREEGLSVVYKRLGAAPRQLTATKTLLDSDLERLRELKNCPAIFQEQIQARCDVRVTVIGEELYAAEIDSQSGESPLDWRFDHTVAFKPHQLDKETEDSLLRLMGALGLFYGAIDLRLTPEGEYVFLEVNPAGQYLFVELLTGMPLTERLAEFLSCSYAGGPAYTSPL